jgi:hypothetical protein
MAALIRLTKLSRRSGRSETATIHRLIKLPAPAIEALERHRKRQEQERSRMVPSWNNHELVFCTLTQHEIRPVADDTVGSAQPCLRAPRILACRYLASQRGVA